MVLGRVSSDPDLVSGIMAAESENKITISTLSKLIGFPKNYIKDELLISGESISLGDLRKSALHFLDDSFKLSDK